ncbi:hypothetical protein X777_14641, partial [Ooceraea biroi]
SSKKSDQPRPSSFVFGARHDDGQNIGADFWTGAASTAPSAVGVVTVGCARPLRVKVLHGDRTSRHDKWMGFDTSNRPTSKVPTIP